MIDSFYPIQNPRISKLLKNVPSISLGKLDDKQQKEFISNFVSQTIKWLRSGPNKITGFDVGNWFPYIVSTRIMALNQIFQLESKRFISSPNETKLFNTLSIINNKKLLTTPKYDLREIITSQDMYILTRPNQYTFQDNIDQIMMNIIRANKTSIISDMYLMGICEPIKTFFNETDEYVIISFSNLFSLPESTNVLLMTRHPIGIFELINQINFNDLNIISYLMKNIHNNQNYDDYIRHYVEIIKEMELESTKCILFGRKPKTNEYVFLINQLEERMGVTK